MAIGSVISVDRYPILQTVPNLHELRLSISLAAARATVMLRAVGGKLSPKQPDVPVAAETEGYLLMLLNQAVESYYQVIDEADANGDRVLTDVEGWSNDRHELFDVMVIRRDDGGFVATVSMNIS